MSENGAHFDIHQRTFLGYMQEVHGLKEEETVLLAVEALRHIVDQLDQERKLLVERADPDASRVIGINFWRVRQGIDPVVGSNVETRFHQVSVPTGPNQKRTLHIVKSSDEVTPT